MYRKNRKSTKNDTCPEERRSVHFLDGVSICRRSGLYYIFESGVLDHNSRWTWTHTKEDRVTPGTTTYVV